MFSGFRNNIETLTSKADDIDNKTKALSNTTSAVWVSIDSLFQKLSQINSGMDHTNGTTFKIDYNANSLRQKMSTMNNSIYSSLQSFAKQPPRSMTTLTSSNDDHRTSLSPSKDDKRQFTFPCHGRSRDDCKFNDNPTISCYPLLRRKLPSSHSADSR
jgi:hypothetical protein